MTLERQWQMLRSIPRYPARKSTQQLHAALISLGYEVTDRTVARDLESLSAMFGFTCEEDGRAKLWFWPTAVRVMDIPGMDPATALGWLMARDHLRQTLPPAASTHLSAHFDRAEAILDQDTGKGRSWVSMFRVRTRGPQQLRPAVNEEVMRSICDALLHRYAATVRYRSRSSGRLGTFLLHPHGLVLQDGIYYLIAQAHPHTDLRHFALNRMYAVAVDPATTFERKPLNLDTYVIPGIGGQLSAPLIHLELRVTASVAEHLRECPLSRDQSIGVGDAEGWCPVIADVRDGAELRWWLLGFGDHLEVIGPVEVRAEMGRALTTAASRYRDQKRPASRSDMD